MDILATLAWPSTAREDIGSSTHTVVYYTCQNNRKLKTPKQEKDTTLVTYTCWAVNLEVVQISNRFHSHFPKNYGVSAVWKTKWKKRTICARFAKTCVAVTLGGRDIDSPSWLGELLCREPLGGLSVLKSAFPPMYNALKWWSHRPLSYSPEHLYLKQMQEMKSVVPVIIVIHRNVLQPKNINILKPLFYCYCVDIGMYGHFY